VIDIDYGVPIAAHVMIDALASYDDEDDDGADVSSRRCRVIVE
jgi:hypothetical protein